MAERKRWRRANPWVAKVHDEMLWSGATLTPEQIRTLHGTPKGGVSITDLLESSGLFEVLYGRFRAVERLEDSAPKWKALESMGAVPSIFHLG